jgi:hypothetical protein
MCHKFGTETVNYNKKKLNGSRTNNNNNNYYYYYYYYYYSALRPVWQEPGPSQATGLALARCISRQVCHCFPLPLDVPTFAARCLHVPINASASSSERWNCGREWSGNFAEMTPFYAI